ncbi:MAG: hemolysin family protein [Proteobacteria bacterium]|nr:hemolysin family protein [Pseudomonadota bacterium]
MTTLIVYFCLAITVSFTCSLLEATILSLTHAHIEVLIKNGHRSGHMLKALKDKINHPLAAILTLNTIANTVGAAGVGAQAQVVFGSKWVALLSGVLTLAILVFSEIIPKTLGAAYWKNLGPAAAYLIRGMIIITYPLVVIFEALARLISPKGIQIKITREEMIVAAEMGLAAGELRDRERAIIRNLLRLNNITARDILTPRSVLFALPQDQTACQIIEERKVLPFARIPVYGKDLDDITGLVRRWDIRQACTQNGGDRPISELANPIFAVPETKSVTDLLDEFILRREHIFLVVDEYGGTQGVITLEDAIETLLGVEIVDELDSVDDMRKYAREQWEKRKAARNM